MGVERVVPEEFYVSGKNLHCPDFVKDISLNAKDEKEEGKEG